MANLEITKSLEDQSWSKNKEPIQKKPTSISLKPFKNTKVSSIDIKISSIAKQTFLELAAAFAFNVAIFTFFAFPFQMPISIALFNRAIIFTTLSMIPKMAWDIYHYKEQNDDFLLKKSRDLAGISTANTVGLAGPTPLIHECGHAAAAHLLFKNPGVKIKIHPFREGHTSYYVSRGLTRIGNFFGKENAILFVTSAGMMASTVFAMFEFGMASRLKEQYPTISQWLNYHGISQILNDVIYGLTAFVARRTDLSHDFIRLWTMGEIHPLIPISLMITLPLLEVIFLKLLCSRERAQKVSQISNKHFALAI